MQKAELKTVKDIIINRFCTLIIPRFINQRPLDGQERKLFLVREICFALLRSLLKIKVRKANIFAAL